MKKLVYCLVITLLAGILLSSCGEGKKCPAYSKADTTQQKNV